MPNPPTVFISYRREFSADLARYVYEELTRLGADVFFDVEDINGGRFDATIEREIINRQHLLLILAPRTLESEWVRREIETALKHGKNIIPVETGGFNFDQHVPSELTELKNYGGIPYDFKSPETTFKRLSRALDLTLPTVGTRRAWSAPSNSPLSLLRRLRLNEPWAIILAAIITGLFVVIAAQIGSQSPSTPTPTPNTTGTFFAASRTAQALTQSAIATSTSSPTPEPSVTPSLTPTSIVVALIPVRIISASGIEIGNGTVRVFAPEGIESSQSTTVELELNLDYRYITPTPAGPITPFPVTRITSTPRPGKPTPTPRIPIHEETGITAYQRMGASLLCLSESFMGCDTTRDPATAKLVDWEEGAKWSWIIAPTQRFIGLQSLQLELWTIKRINDSPEQADVVWDYAFLIEVKSPVEVISFVKLIQDNVGVVIGGAFTIGAALIGTGFIWRRKKSNKSKVFISYRRKVGWSTARSIKEGLSEKGADVFLDVDDINEGRFEDIIKKAIVEREYFVLVLAPTTLESEWVVKETKHAIQYDKKIIPVLVDEFKLDDSSLPTELQSIKSHNSITLTPESFPYEIERLARFVGLETEKGR